MSLRMLKLNDDEWRLVGSGQVIC